MRTLILALAVMVGLSSSVFAGNQVFITGDGTIITSSSGSTVNVGEVVVSNGFIGNRVFIGNGFNGISNRVIVGNNLVGNQVIVGNRFNRFNGFNRQQVIVGNRFNVLNRFNGFNGFNRQQVIVGNRFSSRQFFGF